MAQMQLLQQRLSPRDAIFTPDWVAKDMVEYFKPTGKILEPCFGDGVFIRYLPKGTEWCEIDKGRDFFAWNEQVDWMISNPPYSLMDEWVEHSFQIAENFVYLIYPGNFFRANIRVVSARKLGWIKHIRFYGTGNRLGFPSGNAVAAVHFVRGYQGDTSWSWYAPNTA
jgi:hypothetical protein